MTPASFDRMQQRSGVVGRRHTEVDQVQLRIVGALLPDRPAAALVERQSVPAVAAGLARPGDGVEAPELLARIDVESDDESAAGEKLAVTPWMTLSPTTSGALRNW